MNIVSEKKFAAGLSITSNALIITAKILAGKARKIELSPQNQQIRKLQHALVEQHNLESTSIGEGTQRHLRITNK